MKMDNLNTDKVFREKLEGFSQQPPSHVWSNIQEKLLAQKRKKRIVFYSRIAAAAVIILAFIAGWYFSDQTKEIIPQTVNSESTEPELNQQKQDNETKIAQQTEENESIKSNQIQTAANYFAESEKNDPIVEDSFNRPVDNELKLLERISMVVLERKKINVQKEINISLDEIADDEITPSDRVLIAENLKAMKTSATNEPKWKMGVHISPGYSSQSVNYSNAYANNMVYSGNEGNSNVTGGFSVQYKAGKRWSVETGVYYDQNGKNSVSTSNFLSKRFEYSDNLLSDASGYYLNYAVNTVNGALEMNSLAGVIEFSGLPEGSEIVANFDGTITSGSNILLSSGEYSQVFGFVEIPLYLRYSIIDSKFGVELMGGLNTGILSENNVFFERGGTTRNIGKTKDIARVNVSGTVGMGVNYALGKNFSLSVEPRFSYYLNSINQNPDVNFRPYRIGVYTGLLYSF